MTHRRTLTTTLITLAALAPAAVADVTQTPDVAIAKTASAEVNLDAGGIDYTITLTNAGQVPVPLSQVRVTDTIPGYTPVALTAPASAPRVLAPAATVTYTLRRTLTPHDCGATLYNNADVRLVVGAFQLAEASFANNHAQVSSMVVCPKPAAVVSPAAQPAAAIAAPAAVVADSTEVTVFVPVTTHGRGALSLSQNGSRSCSGRAEDHVDVDRYQHRLLGPHQRGGPRPCPRPSCSRQGPRRRIASPWCDHRPRRPARPR